MTPLPDVHTPTTDAFAERIAAAAALPAAKAQVAELVQSARRADPSFCTHAMSVLSLSGRIGIVLGLRKRELRSLEVAAALHDIGKATVPPEVLAKEGPLDDGEWAYVRAHPVEGERLLAPYITTPAVLEIVRSHHERWDATGYPDRLAGPTIPLGARIVAVADAYVAMLERRPYRAPLSNSSARAELMRERGRQFDSDCVRAALLVTRGDRRPEAAAVPV
jgi:HD-GYP domain-containing protein (c-di-GMP phosphodiesterase class II)